MNAPDKLRLRSIDVAGFRGVGDPLRLDFHPNASLISAPNGSGKTSLLGAIEWCLFGRLEYQPKENATNDELVNLHHPSREGQVTLVLDGDQTEIEIRRKKRIGKRATEVRVTRSDGAVVEGVDAEAAIFRSLGLVFEDFFRAVFLHQESIRGLLVDEPAVRNEALDRLFGVDKLRDVLKGLSPKPVRDTISKIEAERQRATARLTGAVTQIEAARIRALDQATKDGLTDEELTWANATEVAYQLAQDVASIALSASVDDPAASVPENIDDVDSFLRSLTATMGKVRRSDADGQASRELAERIVSIRTLAQELETRRSEIVGFDSEFDALQAEYGNPTSCGDAKRDLDAAVNGLDTRISRLGVAQRIAADTLSYLRADDGATTCPACRQPVDRLSLIAKLDGLVQGDLQAELQSAEESRREQLAKLRTFDAALDKYGRLKGELEKKQSELIALEERAQAELGDLSAGEGLAKALHERARQREVDAAASEKARKEREDALQSIEAARDRFKKIVTYLKEDENWKLTSSRLGQDDPSGSVADNQLEALQSLEEDIEIIGRALSEEAGVRARTLLQESSPAIENFYARLCKHPYFDHLAISVEAQRVSGLDRNNYLIRALASSDAVTSLASSRLSTAQMNCVALSLYLALATRLDHNLGFIILDDPSQSLDEDHKEALASALTHLRAHLQLVVATQDEQFAQMLTRSWGDECREFSLSWTSRAGSQLMTANA